MDEREEKHRDLDEALDRKAKREEMEREQQRQRGQWVIYKEQQKGH